MPTDYASLAKKAATLTNKELAQGIAQITQLTTQDLSKLFPTKRDKESLARLIALVRKETAEDEAIARLGESMTELGSVTVRILRKFL